VRGLTPGSVNSVNSSTSNRSASSIRVFVAETSSRQVTNVTIPSAAITNSNTHAMMRVRAVDGSTRRHLGRGGIGAVRGIIDVLWIATG
jgi:hypothetical protein